MIRVLHDHCGTRVGGAEVNGSKVAVQMLREPMTRADWTTHDYNVHFCFGLENTGDTDIEADVSVEGGNWDTLPTRQPLLYDATDPHGPFVPSDLQGRTDLRRGYAIRVPLRPGERRYVANTLVRELTNLTATFDRLAQAGGAEMRVIGRTLEGREILAYVYGNPEEQGAILVTSGFHPPEPDTLASAAIMEFLATSEGHAITEKIAVAVVPIANPDGYANGAQGSNAAGINFYWHFARELPDRCPEAAALWAFATSLAPRGYVDFHCYTFQLAKRAGPYHRPLFFLDSESARVACEALYRRLDETVPGKVITGFATFAPHTLGAMLAARFDTIALAKYHLHLVEGEDGCRVRGLGVFKALSGALLEHQLVGRAPVKSATWRYPLRRALELWAGLLHPTLGRLRRGQIKDINLNRIGLMSPFTGAADEIA